MQLKITCKQFYKELCSLVAFHPIPEYGIAPLVDVDSYVVVVPIVGFNAINVMVAVVSPAICHKNACTTHPIAYITAMEKVRVVAIVDGAGGVVGTPAALVARIPDDPYRPTFHISVVGEVAKVHIVVRASPVDDHGIVIALIAIVGPAVHRYGHLPAVVVPPASWVAHPMAPHVQVPVPPPHAAVVHAVAGSEGVVV